MKEILFGTAYYPEYMSYDRVETDLQMMSDAGMNVVRIAESTWSTLEPEEGTYDFQYIDMVLAEAERLGMYVIVGTPTYAIPSWLEKKDPAVMAVTKDGRERYGHRQKMDITNPTYRACGERVIRKLVEHTAERKCVIGFQIDNETKHYGIAGEHIQKQFQEYLKEKYKTVENLNRAFYLPYWSNSIKRWDDFPDMRGCVNGGLASEFEKFQRTLVTDFLKWQSDLVREYKREDQFITHNMDFEWKKFGADIAQDGYSYGVQPDADHLHISKVLDIAGTDIYHPTQDDLTGAEIAFCGDEIRCLKAESPAANYLVLECQAQAFKYWTPYPGQLRLHAYSHLASGAMGMLYWNWHSIHNGYETYWKGLLSHDLQKNCFYEEACAFGKEWERIGQEHLMLEKKNKTALVVDNHTLTSYKWFPIDKDLSYNDVVRWMYDSLYEINIECDVVHSEALDVEKYKMIVVPALYSVSEELTEVLKEFVKNGGILISSFKSFVADRSLSVWPDGQPHGLRECFGMSYQAFTEPGTAQVDGYPVEYFAELLTPDTAQPLSVYDHPYWKDYSAVTKNKFGLGTAYYIGCYTDKEVLKKIYRSAAEDAGILQELPGAAAPLIVRNGKNRLGHEVHYLFNYSSEGRKWNSPYKASVDLLTGKEYEKGSELCLSDWGVMVLEEI